MHLKNGWNLILLPNFEKAVLYQGRISHIQTGSSYDKYNFWRKKTLTAWVIITLVCVEIIFYLSIFSFCILSAAAWQSKRLLLNLKRPRLKYGEPFEEEVSCWWMDDKKLGNLFLFCFMRTICFTMSLVVCFWWCFLFSFFFGGQGIVE